MFDTSSEKNDYTLSSVKNALRILRSFTVDHPEKKISELSKTLGLGKSTISRLMLTLASEGFVVKDPRTQRYRLGAPILALSNVLTKHLDIPKESLPILQNVVKKLNETVHVSMLEGTNVVYLHVVESKHTIRYFTQVGESNPAYCTSSGKAILAFQDQKKIQEVIEKGLQPYTETTILDPSDLLDQLKTIRENGYAVSNQELKPGVMGIAAPIRNHLGEVFGAVSIVGPIERMKEKSITIYADEIRDAALKISLTLGFAP